MVIKKHNDLITLKKGNRAMSEVIGKYVLKLDNKKPFSEEQLSFTKSFKDVEIEIQEDRLVVLSKLGQLATEIATKIAQKFHKDLRIQS